MLREADSALDAAKRKGRNRVEAFIPVVTLNTAAEQQLSAVDTVATPSASGLLVFSASRRLGGKPRPFHPRELAADAAGRSGSTAKNRLPSPNTLSTPIRPPCASTIRLVMASPSPVPD